MTRRPSWGGVLVLVAALAGCKTMPAPNREESRAQAPVAAPKPAAEPDSAAAIPQADAPAPSENPPPVSQPAAAAPSCSCAQPAVRPRPKRKKPKTAVASSEAQSMGPVPPPADTVVDAEVGRVDGPLASILGKDVYSPKGENLGRIIDLLSDPEGRVRVAIIDFGGFLGVGTRHIAVDWPLLHFNPADKDKPLVLTVTREKLQSAPEYKDAASPRVLMPPATGPDASGADTKK